MIRTAIKRFKGLAHTAWDYPRKAWPKKTPEEIRERAAAKGQRLAHNSTLPLQGDRGKAKAAEMRVAKRNAFAASGGWCVWPGCCYPAVDPHHKQGAGQGGPNTTGNIAPLCRFHHDECRDNRPLAESLGLVISGARPIQPVNEYAPSQRGVA